VSAVNIASKLPCSDLIPGCQHKADNIS